MEFFLLVNLGCVGSIYYIDRYIVDRIKTSRIEKQTSYKNVKFQFKYALEIFR